jgi:hypothetical protein
MADRLDEKITEALFQGTEDSNSLVDSIWANIEPEVDFVEKKKKFRLGPLKVAVCAAVVLTVLVATTQPGKAAIGKIKEVFAPKKVVVQEVEGIKTEKQVDLQENGKNYIIYYDKEMFTMTKTGTKDKIEPKQKNDNLPAVFMEIEHIKDKNVKTMAAELETQLKAKYPTVQKPEEVTKPLKSTFILAQSGNKRNDTVIRYFLVDNTKGGTFVIKQQFFLEAEEGFGTRFNNMLKEFKVVDLEK